MSGGLSFVLAAAACLLLGAASAEAQTSLGSTPIEIGRSFALASEVMEQTREINIWLPAGYDPDGEAAYPVLYLLDGGQTQDFHHITGLAQLGSVNGSTRAIIVVGIASEDRRNELAPPTVDPDLASRFPTQGQSGRFRRFLAEEVLPFVESRYRISGHSTLMGESLGGLFVVETFLDAPDMFDAYVAVSPSLWWDGGEMARSAGQRLRGHSDVPRQLILTLGDEGPSMQEPMETLVARLRQDAPAALEWSFTPRPMETHATIYHGAALDAVRQLYRAPTP